MFRREVPVSSGSGRQHARGFALLEVVIASGVIAVIAAGSSVLVSMAIHASRQSRARTMATALAAAKLEQLRSLSWTHVTTTGPAISMSVLRCHDRLEQRPRYRRRQRAPGVAAGHADLEHRRLCGLSGRGGSLGGPRRISCQRRLFTYAAGPCGRLPAIRTTCLSSRSWSAHEGRAECSSPTRFAW